MSTQKPLENTEAPKHTPESTKFYAEVERMIKKSLTEYLTLTYMPFGKDYLRNGLSINEDFSIRELNTIENEENRMSVAHIKSPVLYKTVTEIKEELFKIINTHVSNESIAEAYRNGVEQFLREIERKNIRYRKQNPIFLHFLKQYYTELKTRKDISEEEKNAMINIHIQTIRILYERFGEKMFKKIEKDNDGNLNPDQILELDEKCTEYCYLIFHYALQVRSGWNRNIQQVFHDGDFPFITKDKKGELEDYFDAIKYLIDPKKFNPFGRRNEKGEGDRAWAQKTTQFSDILWALTNPIFGIDQQVLQGETEAVENKENKFEWDSISKELFERGRKIIQNKVDTYNTYFLNKENNEFPLSCKGRLKSLPSTVEKIIEGKEVQDIIGYRISMKKSENTNFHNLIDRLVKPLILDFAASIGNGENQKGIRMQMDKNIILDNKGMLTDEEVLYLIEQLNPHFIIKKREKTASTYIEKTEWEKKMETYYPEDVADEKKMGTYTAFFEQFTKGKVRGRNGHYKDFKFGITIDIIDDGKVIDTKHIELQFDDLQNYKGIANFHIRNIERQVNTQSNLTFSISLEDIRKLTEGLLKEMREWTKNEEKERSILDFTEKGKEEKKIDISSFRTRTPENSTQLNEAIIETINYFIKKGTFLLVSEKKPEENESSLPIKNGLLTTECLNSKNISSIRICSAQEIARQQYSYLGEKGGHYIGIYNEKKSEGEGKEQEGRILRATLQDIIEHINLGKKKINK